MTPITLNITLNTSEALTGAVEALADALRGLSISNNFVMEPHTQPAPVAQPAAVEEPKSKPTVPLAPTAAAPHPAPARALTEDDIRKAINDKRVALGCGHYNEVGTYIADADSTEYKHYNKALSKEALQIADLLSSGCKPTTLPVESRQSFIDRLGAIIPDGKGGLTSNVPF